MPIWLLTLNGHQFWSGMWLGVDLRKDMCLKNSMCFKVIGLCAHNLLTMLGSIVNIIEVMIIQRERTSSL